MYTNFSNTFHLDFSDLSWEKAKSFGSFFLVPNLAFKRGESNFIRVKVWVNNAFDPTKQGDRKATRSTKRVFSFAKGVQELVMEFLIAVICVIYWLEKWQVQFKESVKILPLWLACFLSVFSPISSTFLALMASLIWSRDIICLHILLNRKKNLCSKICKQIMSLDQMRDPNLAKRARSRRKGFLTLCLKAKKLQGN